MSCLVFLYFNLLLTKTYIEHDASCILASTLTRYGFHRLLAQLIDLLPPS